jgi:protein SCO1/2
MPRFSHSLLAPLIALLLVITACAQPPSLDARRSASADAPTATADAASVYDLASVWKDQHGTARPLSSLRGRPRVVALIYTHCTATCPLALGEMMRIAAATDSGVGLVLVSLDPARDSMGALARYAREHNLDATRWTLLAGSSGDVRELAAVLGIRYRALGPDAIAHSNVITILDANGVIVHQQSGFDGTADAIRVAHTLTR